MKRTFAQYVAEQLAILSIDTCFMVTGGGAMHLNDAFGKNKKLKKVFCHHEQACAMAAESYARMSGKPAVLQVTTGPGRPEIAVKYAFSTTLGKSFSLYIVSAYFVIGFIISIKFDSWSPN